jgi:hypothetical protein
VLAFAAVFPLAVACGHSDDGDDAAPARIPNGPHEEKIAYAHGQEIFVVNPTGAAHASSPGTRRRMRAPRRGHATGA